MEVLHMFERMGTGHTLLGISTIFMNALQKPDLRTLPRENFSVEICQRNVFSPALPTDFDDLKDKISVVPISVDATSLKKCGTNLVIV